MACLAFHVGCTSFVVMMVLVMVFMCFCVRVCNGVRPLYLDPNRLVSWFLEMEERVGLEKAQIRR